MTFKEHIEDHFLIYFIYLVILRLLQYKTNYKYSIKGLINSLKFFNVRYQNANYYQLLNFSKRFYDISHCFNIDFSNSLTSKKKFSNLLK